MPSSNGRGGHHPRGGGAERRFQPDSRGGFFNQPGDYATLTATGAALTRYASRTHRHKRSGPAARSTMSRTLTATASPPATTAAGSSSLTHTSGPSLQFTYNAAGLIVGVTDSDGRTTTYTYDATNH